MLTLLISALTDFIISAGGALLTAMTATGTAAVPSIPVIIFAVVTGAVAAARGVQKNLSPSVMGGKLP